MIVDDLKVTAAEFERGTGWAIKPEGACRDLRCVPLPVNARRDGRLDVEVVAGRLGMPVVADPDHHLWAVGPQAGGRALSSAVAPNLVLPDWRGQEFRLEGLRGLKVLLVCWASW